MKNFTLAHISDLHISGLYRRDNIRKTKKLLEHLALMQVDHLAVTGDITADATEKDFRIARSLFAGTGWLAPEKLSVVVGNHDIFGGVHTAEDILAFPARCRVTNYMAKLGLFREMFREAFEGALLPSRRAGFPFAKVFGNLLLVGMNSVSQYARVKNPVGSNGRVDATQFAHVTEVLTSPLFERMKKIVLIHHHFCKYELAGGGGMFSLWSSLEKHTMKLRGKKDLLRLFRRTNVDLILHGHLHVSTDYRRKGVRFLNGGASILNDSEVVSLTNIIEVSERGITVSAAKPISAMQHVQHLPLLPESLALPPSEAA